MGFWIQWFWDLIVGIRIKTCVVYKMEPVQHISIQQKLLDRLSIQTSIMDTDTHTFCTIQRPFPYQPGYHPETPISAQDENMCQYETNDDY